MSKTFIITKKNIPMIAGMLAKNLCIRPFIKGYHCFNTSFKKRVRSHYTDLYPEIDVSYLEDQIHITVVDLGVYTLNLGDRVRFSGNRVEIAIYDFENSKWGSEYLRNLYLVFCYESYPLKEVEGKSMKFRCYDFLDVEEEYML